MFVYYDRSLIFAVHICVIATAFRTFYFLFAHSVIFWMCLENVRCVSRVMMSIFGVLLRSIGVLFTRTCG